jgi:DNA processing protein
MPPGNIADWIALTSLPGLGPIHLRRLLELYGDPTEIAYRLPVAEMRRLPRFPQKAARAIQDARPTLRKQAERDLKRCDRMGIRLLPLYNEDYPAAFLEIHDRPILIYMKGTLPQDLLRVAVVGSRLPTRYGKKVATGLSASLAVRGIEVVSGGALGIDSCAHQGALEEEGRTVAILGTGLANRYPAENGALFERIAKSGALLTEFGLDEPPLSGHFPRRNRLISALSAAVVVVEAATRSGSLNTASHALEQGKEVLAVPGPVSSSRSQGCHKLIQQGAKLIQNIGDILDELPPLYLSALSPDSSDAAPGPTADLASLSVDETRILELLDPVEPLQLDELAERVPFGVARLQSALFSLTLRGAVEQIVGGRYLLRP